MSDRDDSLWAVISARDATIARLQHALKERDIALEEKEAVIQAQSRKNQQLKEMQGMCAVIYPLLRLALPVYRIVKPRLGNLRQYPPRALQLPHYRAKKWPASTTAPRISIVTPSFNQKDFIERTIESVLNQAYPRLEYYIQDGASEDGTLRVLQRYVDRLSGWESSPDSGQSQAINRGFARTSGDIMAWLNSDDIFLPGTMHYVADYFIRHPEVDVVYGHRIMIDEDDMQIGQWIMPAHDNGVLSWADFIPQETMFWRRSIWEKSGGYIDESFRFAMDWELIFRFREAGARFARLPRFLGGFRIHPCQKTSSEISEIGVDEMNRIRQRALGRTPQKTEISRALWPYLLRHIAIDLAWRIRNGIH